MKTTQQTLGQWLQENKLEIINEVNESLKIYKNPYSGTVQYVSGRSKRDCYSKGYYTIQDKLAKLIVDSELTYDGLPVIISGRYDVTSSDTTSNREFRFELKLLVDKEWDSEEKAYNYIHLQLGSVTFTIKFKLQSMSCNGEFLIKDLTLVSKDETITELVNDELNYITKVHKEAFDVLKNDSERYRKELLEQVDKLDNGEYKRNYYLDSMAKRVENGWESAQKSIQFFTTIETIKSKNSLK